ncbi:MAG: LlaJI family restriction endonuclease [Bacteroidales bacterium]|nr:LlaJI family restriction endonuclease [Bacteroidales bacterium]
MKYSIVNISETEKGGRSFVGISNIKDTDKTRIVVPYGFQISSVVGIEDKDSIDQLRRYVKVIQKALHTYVAQREEIDFSKGMNSPLAAVNIIQDYLSMGSFVEFEKTLQESDKGKINFRQTIKKIHPRIIGGGFFYDSFITDKKLVVEDNLIALIQGNIINHFMSHGGDVLFGRSLVAQVLFVNLDNKQEAHHAIRLLREEQNNTFNSRKQNLIRWSIDYIRGLLIPNYEERGEWNYAIVASSLWEIIVDYVFGNQKKRDKTVYGTTYRFFDIATGKYTEQGSSTEHDTIYEDDEYIFIIDSKMYASQNDLLTEAILGKQFGYYLSAKKKKPHKKIVNMLFLPCVDCERGFQSIFIPDPNAPKLLDPDKMVFLYCYPVNDLIDDYYYGRKRIGKIKKDFLSFTSSPKIRAYLDERGTSF